MAGLLGGGGGSKGGGGLLSGVTDTLNQTTKGLPIVGGITEPLLDTVGGVTDSLPIASASRDGMISLKTANLCEQVGAPDGGKKQAQTQQVPAQDPEAAALAKKKKMMALKKRQLALDMEEMEMGE